MLINGQYTATWPCSHGHYGGCLACYGGSNQGSQYNGYFGEWTQERVARLVKAVPLPPPVVERTPDPNIAAMYDADSGDA